MFLALGVALAIFALAMTFYLRPQDLPQGAGATPWKHLEGRKASIYDNLRDLQFEYRVGKLSDADYQRTKLDLQAELAGVLSEIDRLKAEAGSGAPVAPKQVKAAAVSGFTCPHCGARFDKTLKFCGECGKPMGASA